MRSWKLRFLQVSVCATLSSLLALTGCGQFFPPLGSGGGGTGSSSGDYLYVGNLGTNPQSLDRPAFGECKSFVAGNDGGTGMRPSTINSKYRAHFELTP